MTTASVVAACGGSSHKHANTQTVASTPTTAAAGTGAKTTAKPSHRHAAGVDKSHLKAGAGGAPNKNGTAVDPANTHPTAPGPKPLDCLRHAGLLDPRPSREANVWLANWRISQPTNPQSWVFVDGPYKTVQAASHAIARVKSVEIAQRGGLYRITAAIPSHVQAEIASVAKCLGGAGAPTSISHGYTF